MANTKKVPNAPAIGERVAHHRTGTQGTVVGWPIPARSAGGALMVRVQWDGPYARPGGSPAFVRHLVTAPDA